MAQKVPAGKSMSQYARSNPKPNVWMHFAWKIFVSSFRCPHYCPRIATLVTAAAAALFLWTQLALSATSNICDRAIHKISGEFDVPISVLQTLARTETGRPQNGALRPWPWTVNMNGSGHWFQSKREAYDFVMRHYMRGERSFDLGCFQINYRWHGESFQSIGQMFDPLANARYATALIRRHYQEFGDWSLAAGAYHSRTPKHANAYRARFDRIHRAFSTRFSTAETTRPTGKKYMSAVPEIRQNTYPLLTRRETGLSRGSLVPLNHGHSRSFIALRPNTGIPGL